MYTNNIKGIISEFKKGNRNAIKDIVIKTRTHVLNTIRTIVDDDEKAIKIAEEIYRDLLLNPDNISSDGNFDTYINSLIQSKVRNYTKDIKTLKSIESTDTNISTDNIDINEFKKYYNNPKVEKIIYQTINSLDEDYKVIAIDYYFFNIKEEELAKKYNSDVNTISAYISKINELIDKKSKPLFIKNKIINGDYSGISIVYSTIKLGYSIMSFDVLGIAVDKIEEQLQDKKDDENKEKDLKDFVEDIIKDYVKDWFLEKIKSAFITGVSATSIVNAKAAGMSLIKKIIIGTAITGVVTTGVVTVYNVTQNTYENKKSNVNNLEPSIQTNTNILINDTQIPVSLKVYCDDHVPEEIKTIFLDVDVPNDNLNTKELDILELSSKAVSGFDVYSDENSKYTTIHVVVEKDNLNENLIDFVEGLDVVDQNIIDKAKKFLNCNKTQFNKLIEEYGLKSK